MTDNNTPRHHLSTLAAVVLGVVGGALTAQDPDVEQAQRVLSGAAEPRGNAEQEPAPLRELIGRLDGSGGDVAMGELRRLGALAVPALLDALGYFEAYGIHRAATVLANQGAEAQAVRRLARRDDQVAQVAALELMNSTDDPSCGAALLDSKHAAIRVRAALALASAGGHLERAQAIAKDALSDPDLAETAVATLAHAIPAHAQAQADATLDLLERDTPELAKAFCQHAVYAKKPWPRPIETRLRDGDDRALDLAVELGLPIPRESMQTLLWRHVDENGIDKHPARASALLAATEAMHPLPDFALEALGRAIHTDLGSMALAILEERAPDRLAAMTPDLIYGETAKEWLREHAGPDHARYAARGLKREWEEWLEWVVTHRSDGSNLQDILVLVENPIPYGRRDDLRRTANGALERWFASEHVAAAVQAIPNIDAEVSNTILRLCAEHATEAAAPALADCLQQAREHSPELNPDDNSGAPLPRHKWIQGVVSALGSAGGPLAEAALLPILEEDHVRTHALRVLLKITGDRVALLRRVLQRPDAHEFLSLVAGAREATADEEIRSAMLAVLRGVPDELDPGWVLHDYLNEMPAEQRVASAIELLANGAETPHLIASLALGKLAAARSADHCDVLRPMLAHPSDRVRRAAIEALAASFDRRTVPHLMAALRDPDGDNRRVAQQALGDLYEFESRTEHWNEVFGLGEKTEGEGKK